MIEPMRIGIITGVEQEAAAFLPDQPGTTEQRAGLSIRHLDHAVHSIAITCSGVGKVNATHATTTLAAAGLDLIMIIGTAGSLGTIAGDCFILADAVQGDYGAARSEGFTHYTAGTWPIGPAQVHPFKACAIPDIGLPLARIASSDCFLECPSQAALLRNQLGADLVDMETAALAQVAGKLGLPWAGIKATTDDANHASGGDFMDNLVQAAKRAAQAAEQIIASI
ncbi:MAG: purine phosphorylase [Alphaproteobacteria bacterium]|nr:purine phosphorylase [Alphaproteobacteria bacterium]